MPETHPISPAGFPQLESLAPITLGEMDSIKLMNRIDSKYLTDLHTLAGILEDAAREGYMALETLGSKMAAYDSIYFDTPGLKMYLDHHNKHLTRQKVRTRVYVDSGLTFLEIKRKNNHGRTKKKRTAIPGSDFKDFRSNEAACEYLAGHSWFVASQLAPALETAFSRITLVNPAKTERVTIDTSLVFNNIRTGREVSLPDAVVIEIKQDGHCPSSMKGILLGHRVKPVRVSKYCIGTALTDPCVKANRFKPKIRMIEKLINTRLI